MLHPSEARGNGTGEGVPAIFEMRSREQRRAKSRSAAWLPTADLIDTTDYECVPRSAVLSAMAGWACFRFAPARDGPAVIAARRSRS